MSKYLMPQFLSCFCDAIWFEFHFIKDLKNKILDTVKLSSILHWPF